MALWFAKETVLGFLINTFTLELAVMHVALRVLLVYSVIVALLSFGRNYWQSTSGINSKLSENAYTIYLIHLVIVFLLQLLMYKWWDVSVYLKFMAGCALSIALTYFVSEFAIISGVSY